MEFDSQRDAWAGYLGASSGATSAWCEMREEFSPEFRAELDGVLSKTACVSLTPGETPMDDEIGLEAR